MSDGGRRREVRVSGSEELSESSYEDADAVKGLERDRDLNMSEEGLRESEYESADNVDAEHTDSESEILRAQVEDDREDGDLSDSVIIEYEREEGDGQESTPPKEKKLDDDEDRRNPQYIPKRGTFYEHDDRTAAEDIDEQLPEKETERNKESQGEKKKVWKEHESRWNHDRFNEDEQSPKSRDELVAIYGYDIRNEEGPPRARRRRRYGRGPNKYTRNWEDEDAYNKPPVPTIVRGRGRGRGGRRQVDSEEDFPPLGPSVPSDEQQDTVPSVIFSSRNAWTGTKQPLRESVSPEQLTKEEQHREEAPVTRDDKHADSESTNAWKKDSNENRLERDDTKRSAVVSWKNERRHRGSVGEERREGAFVEDRHGPAWKRNSRVGRQEEMAEEQQLRKGSKGRGTWPAEEAFTTSGTPPVGRGSRGSGGRGRGSAPFSLGRGRGSTKRSVSETRMSSQDEGSGSDTFHGPGRRAQDDMSEELSRLSLKEPSQGTPRDYNRRSNKTGSNFHAGSERRQTVVPPRMQDNATNRPKRYSSLRQRSLPETGGQPYAQSHTNGYYQPGFVPSPVYSESPPQQQAATTTPPLQILASHPQGPPYAAPYTSPPAFIQPGVAPPPRILPPPGPQPFIAAPAPAAAIYVAPAQGQFPPQPYPPFQGYPAVAPPPQPPELYQPQGGITYYNPEEQPVQRPPTQKRQRAAIPIVPPPERVSRARSLPAGHELETIPDVATGSPSHTEEAQLERKLPVVDVLSEEIAQVDTCQSVVVSALEGGALPNDVPA